MNSKIFDYHALRCVLFFGKAIVNFVLSETFFTIIRIWVSHLLLQNHCGNQLILILFYVSFHLSVAVSNSSFCKMTKLSHTFGKFVGNNNETNRNTLPFCALFNMSSCFLLCVSWKDSFAHLQNTILFSTELQHILTLISSKNNMENDLMKSWTCFYSTRKSLISKMPHPKKTKTETQHA